MDPEVAKNVAQQLARPSGDGGVQITTAMNTTNAFITARSLEALDVSAGERMVEIGPGNGELSVDAVRTLGEGGSYLGFEYEEDIAALARAALGAVSDSSEVRAGDFMSHAPGEPGADALLAVNVLYFFADLDAFTARCRDWLRPGGRAVLGVRSVPAMAGLPFIEHGEFHLRPLDELLRSLSRAGFGAVEARYFDEGTTELGDLTVAVDSIVVRARRAGA
jgi:SAM-dependent methyltransferase